MICIKLAIKNQLYVPSYPPFGLVADGLPPSPPSRSPGEADDEPTRPRPLRTAQPRMLRIKVCKNSPIISWYPRYILLYSPLDWVYSVSFRIPHRNPSIQICLYENRLLLNPLVHHHTYENGHLVVYPMFKHIQISHCSLVLKPIIFIKPIQFHKNSLDHKRLSLECISLVKSLLSSLPTVVDQIILNHHFGSWNSEVNYHLNSHGCWNSPFYFDVKKIKQY